jgi:hypothetical protein
MIKAPHGEYRQMDARHLPLSIGAIGYISKRDGEFLPLSPDGKPVDFFTGSAPSAPNKDGDIKALGLS